MKQNKTNLLVTGLLGFALLGVVAGCMEDVSSTLPETKLPSKEDYFDFTLTGNTQLSVNYGVPGLTTAIEVYDQDPMLDYKTKKEGLNPIYVAYANDGKYEGTMNIPTAVKEAYAYTNTISAPKCVKLKATGTGFIYDITQQEEANTRNSTHGSFPHLAMSLIDKNVFPYEVATTPKNGGKRGDNLFSITAWTANGWETINQDYYKIPATIGAENEEVGVVSARLTAFLNAQRQIDKNKSLLRNPEDINIKVPADVTDGMSVNVTFIGENASFYNTYGYYYYKDNGQTLTPEQFYQIKKYIIIPNVQNDYYTAVTPGETVKLLYFDEDGKQSDKFPANYVIGWFLIANGFGSNHPITGEGGYPNNGLIKQLPADAYTSAAKYSEGRYSCMSDDKGADRRFVSLYDTKSKLRVFGIEDYVHATEPDDYMDVMFVVRTTPDLGGGDLPPIGPVDPKPEPVVWSVTGTLAFEDIWPKGGDYDLNDVIVEYNREITIDDKNDVLKVKETFKPVQPEGSAKQDNFFACQYKNIGKITKSAGVLLEESTNSVVVESSARTISGQSYVIERDLSGLGLNQEKAQADFNPYIITNEYTTANRVEVHLPLMDMTAAADKTLMKPENAYYVGENGTYPFAINIPITGFVAAGETKKIDSEGQYPSFKKWTTSKGEENKDWYLQDKGKK